MPSSQARAGAGPAVAIDRAVADGDRDGRGAGRVGAATTATDGRRTALRWRTVQAGDPELLPGGTRASGIHRRSARGQAVSRAIAPLATRLSGPDDGQGRLETVDRRWPDLRRLQQLDRRDDQT